MIVAYVAGPYSSPDGFEVAQNAIAAGQVGRQLAMLGIVPLIPHTIGWYCEGWQQWPKPAQTAEWWYRATRELMTRCNILVMCPGWEKSRGSVAEHSEWVATSEWIASAKPPGTTQIPMPFYWPQDREKLAEWVRLNREEWDR